MKQELTDGLCVATTRLGRSLPTGTPRSIQTGSPRGASVGGKMPSLKPESGTHRSAIGSISAIADAMSIARVYACRSSK